MWGVIRGLVAEGATVLLTTQYLDEADALADRIVVMDHGRVIAEGTPAELKASTGSQLLEVTLAAPHPLAIEALAGLSVGAVTVSDGGRKLRVPARNEVGLSVSALRALDQVGAQVEDIAVHQPSLDDVFALLTGALVSGEEERISA
jgi:ABC-2 type transport system ATP-binding protein